MIFDFFFNIFTTSCFYIVLPKTGLLFFLILFRFILNSWRNPFVFDEKKSVVQSSSMPYRYLGKWATFLSKAFITMIKYSFLYYDIVFVIEFYISILNILMIKKIILTQPLIYYTCLKFFLYNIIPSGSIKNVTIYQSIRDIFISIFK